MEQFLINKLSRPLILLMKMDRRQLNMKSSINIIRKSTVSLSHLLGAISKWTSNQQ